MIELAVHGAPGACRSAGQDLVTLAGAMGDHEDDVRAAVDVAVERWDGRARGQFRARALSSADDAADAQRRTRRAGTALTRFADELDAVRSALREVRVEAVAGGLVVTADAVRRPAEGGDVLVTQPGTGGQGTAAGSGDDVAAAGRLDLYDRLAEDASRARTREDEAHDDLEAAMEAVDARGLLAWLVEKLGFIPAVGSDPVQTALWAGGLGGFLLSGTSAWLIRVRYGRFAPRGPGGRFLPVGGQPWYTNAWRRGLESNYAARPHMASTLRPWRVAGTWAGRAGPVLTGGLSAWNQWQADADDPALGDAERVARAATVGGSSAAGAWAGAWAGAQVGAMVGSFGGPVGTVVGGALGGAIGGFVGSEAGQWVGEQLAGPVGEATDWVADGVGDLVDGAGDVAADVGDALTFWD